MFADSARMTKCFAISLAVAIASASSIASPVAAVEARFRQCDATAQANCVIDARTIRLGDRLVQLEGLAQVPDEKEPDCTFEAKSAAGAKNFLILVLNRSPRNMQVIEMGRQEAGIPIVRIKTRDGDLSDLTIIAGNGVADPGQRSPWCPSSLL